MRIALSFVVPVWTLTLEAEPSLVLWLVALLSLVVSAAEVCAFFRDMTRRHSKSRAVRPMRYFVLQMFMLYVVQVWMVTVVAGVYLPSRNNFGRVVSGETDAQARVASAAQLGYKDTNVAPFESSTITSATDQHAAPTPSGLINGQFELDAPPEALRWNPKTITVVLPCAEEQDYALKTVQSVFEMTPADVLHEIVVVDDGSNPPLSTTFLKPDVQQHYKVKIARHEQTVGLIGAKKTGGDVATGDLVVFFDCHVAPQKDWYKDFINLIAENYRRMVIPQITSLDVDTWKQIGEGGGMSKCYVTWDGDFKWGGTEDMYMGMLSGGLLGMSKRWWTESGGYDEQMMGWGGENIDQGIRMWVCGGEIVAAPMSQVAHMWRTGNAKTNARYRHVGDTIYNRARAIYAWSGEFAAKMNDFDVFAQRMKSGGPNWYGNMSHFQKVKDRLQGCRPFAWYLRRFKVIYEDAGIIPSEIFMIREERSGKCLHFQGHAGTSGSGAEGVKLEPCDEQSHRFFWHLGNRHPRTKRCCSGLRAWNTEQCFAGDQPGGKGITGICDVAGDNTAQHWKLQDGTLRSPGDVCLGTSASNPDALEKAPCLSFRSAGGGRFTKQAVRIPLEMELYQRAQREHPEVFRKLNEQFKAEDALQGVPTPCRGKDTKCVALVFADAKATCLGEDGHRTSEDKECAVLQLVEHDHTIVVKRADTGRCLDNWSDQDTETWGFYSCHGGGNQKFVRKGSSQEICASEQARECFEIEPWPWRPLRGSSAAAS